MSESEIGFKRSLEEDTQTKEDNKKQKLFQENVIDEPPSEIVKEKDTKVEGNNETTAQEILTQTQEPSVTESNTNEAKEQEMVSADLSKTVTHTPDISEDVTSITSDQLLMALTSIPKLESESSTAAPVSEKVPGVEDPEMAEAPEQSEMNQAEEEKKTDVKTLTPIVITTDKEPVNASPSIPESTHSPHSAPVTGLGVSSKDDASKFSLSSLPQVSPISNKHVSAPTSSSTSAVSSPLKLNNSTDMGSSLSATLSAAPNISISNLPDIKAALRRLSSASVSASVIEQLSSSSPRLPTIGQLNERKGSIVDVSPSEILGNALAAVAANAAARSNHPPSVSQASTSANTTNTAIGSLAAITANISNLLHSGGFQRNSFSQEDTQKLAAAVAVARNSSQQQQQEQQRRKSSITLVGNAFSNMIDQAIMIGRKSISEGSKTTPPPNIKPKLIVKNEQVWKSVEGMEEISLGYQLYSPHLLLPNLESSVNGLMEVLVPARFLTFENTRVQKRAVWGTDIYTDDSDIVAMIVHSGKYQPKFTEPTIEASDPFALAVAGKQKESMEAAKKLALSDKQYIRRYEHLIPDHDLKVTVRVLPKLQHYASSIRHQIKSRDWNQHDGMSLYVDKVEKIKKGEAKLKGRSSLKSNMFAYEIYRKKVLGITTTTKEKVKETESLPKNNIQKGRIKKSSRVLRMFKIHADLKKNSIE